MTSSINYPKKKISQNTTMHPPLPAPQNPKQTQNCEKEKEKTETETKSDREPKNTTTVASLRSKLHKSTATSSTTLVHPRH
jgi:hypothetical protein